ncbi:MAG: Ribosomal protein S8 [uncultured bacterium]|nr:MAG: Ribosomal protein S8 [uncultured bacterium]
MSMDHLSNMLSSIKNASMANNAFVETIHTKELEEVAKTLKKAGFLEEVKVFKQEGNSFKGLHLDLVKENGKVKLLDLKRFSKPGRRVYKSYKDIGKSMGGFGIFVVSTSRGIMDGSEARKKKLGGELICEVK